jgi:hypothetical protein
VESYRDGSPKPRLYAPGDKRALWDRKNSREPSFPAGRKKVAAASLPVQLIARMLLKPELAGRFDVNVDDHEAGEIGTAARVAAFIRDHEFEVNQASVLENFRGSGDEAALDRAASHPLLLDMDMSKLDLDAEFDAALTKLRDDAFAAQKRAEIDRRAREMGLG